MILAGIDIGTNAIRLLIAEAKPNLFHELHSGRLITRLGQGLDRTGTISAEAEERSLDALRQFMTTAREYGAVRFAAVGTSALRNASNAQDFVAKARKELGIDIRVITGEEEARLTLLGVARAFAGQTNVLLSSLVIDIGGGSTEIIANKQGAEPVLLSLPLGAVYLTERFFENDPPTAVQIESLKREVETMLISECGAIVTSSDTVLAGTAGTITTLASMDLKLSSYDPVKINGHIITESGLTQIVADLSKRSIAERSSIPGLEPGREDIILAGAVITQEIMKYFGMKRILVSDWGLREGLVLDLYQKIVEV